MISLILRQGGQEKRFCFKKRTITLGPKGADNVDIPLPVESDASPYAKIEEHNGRYCILNAASDPNLRFGSLPFGRRTLSKGSVITLDDVELIVDSLDNLVEETLQPQESEDEFDDELQRLMKEVDALEQEPAPPVQDQEDREEPKFVFSRWPLALTSVCLLLALLFFGTFYFSTSVKSEEDELRASRGVADAAMAMLYARLHQIKPPNQNWADPQFLHEMVAKVVPKTSPSCCEIDAQGNFKNFPYILRVYTNEDASRFVLVAQPQASFISWVTHKDSIVIESTTMELRKLEDIQPLNRIIFNVRSLNKVSSQRIATLVQEGTLIPLSRLNDHPASSQYTPPHELQIVAPGAQNYVYNAPRYYKLTEPLLTHALEGRVTPNLLKDLNQLMSIPHLVFYTTEGVKSAVKSYKNLSDFITSQKLLVGYFMYNKKTHLPSKTELLVMNQAPHAENKKGVRQEKRHQPIRIQSELYQAMIRLASQRKQALRPVSDRIGDLLYDNNSVPTTGFKEQLVTYLKDYEKVDLTEQRRISRSLKQLYKKQVIQDQKLTNKQFVAYVKATGLAPYVQKKTRSKRAYNPLMQARGEVDSRSGSQSAYKTSVLD